MSNAAIIAATSAATTAAAAAAAARARQEEEDMTKYGANDLEGWEFKIVRSSMGKFSNYQTVQQLCQEESQAGWEMVEKFDNYRIRFKRKIEHRNNDHILQFDPYRTTMGRSGDVTKIMLGVGLTVLLLGVLLTAFFMTR